MALRYGIPYGPVLLETDAKTAPRSDDRSGGRHYCHGCDCDRDRKPEQAVPPGDRARPALRGRRTRCDRTRRCQRRRQIHPDQDPAGSVSRHRGPGRSARTRCRHQGRRHPRAGRLHAGARLPATRRLGHRVRRPHGTHVRPAAHRRSRAHGRHPAPRRPVRGALPPHRRLLHGHEAARVSSRRPSSHDPQPWSSSTNRPTASTRSAATRCSASSAASTPTSASPSGHLAPAGRAGAHLRPRRRGGRRQAAALQLHHGLHPDHHDPRDRGHRHRRTPRRPCCRRSPATTASGCSRSRRPTSPSSPSSRISSRRRRPKK
ncbi:hypothetical protein SVIOM342S_06416 [Streptomyces violaceorubidus]